MSILLFDTSLEVQLIKYQIDIDTSGFSVSDTQYMILCIRLKVWYCILLTHTRTRYNKTLLANTHNLMTVPCYYTKEMIVIKRIKNHVADGLNRGKKL